MGNFTISSKSNPENATCLIKLEGAPGDNDFDPIAAEFENAMDAGPTRIILDLSTLQSPSSALLGLFIDLGKSLAAKKGKLMLAAPSKEVLDLIELLGIKNVFAISAAAAGGNPQPAQPPSQSKAT